MRDITKDKLTFLNHQIDVEIFKDTKIVWVSDIPTSPALAYDDEIQKIEEFNDLISEMVSKSMDEAQLLVSNWEQVQGGYQCSFGDEEIYA